MRNAITQCTGGQDIQFIGKNGKPLVNSNGEGKGVIEIPPDCPKKLASQRTVRNALSESQINISNCTVCNDDTSRFVRKQEFVDSIRQVLGNAYHSGLIPSSWNKKERLYRDELDGILPGIIAACKRSPTCGGGTSDERDSNRFFGCIENQYPSYFPGPGTTEKTDDGYGSVIYFRYYALYQCGPCGQYASESYLATYQRDTYYAFDGYWEYLAPLDEVLVSFCPGW